MRYGVMCMLCLYVVTVGFEFARLSSQKCGSDKLTSVVILALLPCPLSVGAPARLPRYLGRSLSSGSCC